MNGLLIAPALAAALLGLAVLIAVIAIALHPDQARRRDALKALALLVGRRR